MIPGGVEAGQAYAWAPGSTLLAGAPKHRAPLTAALVRTEAHPAGFVARHCAGNSDGGTCMHDHPGDTSRWGFFAPLLRRMVGAS